MATDTSTVVQHYEPVDFTTTDPEQAHAFMKEVYVDNAMRIRGSKDRFLMRHTYHEADQFSVAEMVHTMSVEHTSQPLGQLLIGRVLDGSIERRTDGQSVSAVAGDSFLIAQPDRPYTVEWDDVRLQMTCVGSAALAAVAPRAGTPVRFTALEPVSAASARQMNKTVDFVTRDVLTNPAAATSPLVVGSAARLLAATMLNTFPNTALAGSTAQDRADATPATLRRATRFIDTHAQADITLVDIAAAAHVTPRAVQIAFRRHHGVTPMAYLREAQLARAHRELQGADPDHGDTVTAIAAHWGFAHPGRFAAAYRRAYGKSPSSTLRS